MRELWRFFWRRRLHRLRNARARAMAAVAVPPDSLDCARMPSYGQWLPIKMGSGGWPVEEPTKEQVAHFLKCLSAAANDPASGHHFGWYDEGDFYTSFIKVSQWLRLLVDEDLLSNEERW